MFIISDLGGSSSCQQEKVKNRGEGIAVQSKQLKTREDTLTELEISVPSFCNESKPDHIGSKLSGMVSW